jgi:hypothetical protein
MFDNTTSIYAYLNDSHDFDDEAASDSVIGSDRTHRVNTDATYG